MKNWQREMMKTSPLALRPISQKKNFEKEVREKIFVKGFLWTKP